MGSYETMIDTLAGELTRIEAAFRGLTGPEPARLRSGDPGLVDAVLGHQLGGLRGQRFLLRAHPPNDTRPMG